MLASAVPALAGDQDNAGFRIYFNTKSSVLTEPAENLIQPVLAAINQKQVTSILLVGNTDTAEPKAMALSLARANAVKSALIQHGLPATVTVTTKGVGATEPAVPTGKHQSEPLDRSVSITFQ
jgi:outer membrane protein OmpA-like peptidoglycan-associated protein